MQVRLASGAEREAAIARLVAEWGEPILARGEAYTIGECEIFVAGEMAGLAAVSGRDRPTAELVAINAFAPREGVGTALLNFIADHLEGFVALRLTTTNDNLDALRFYQRRGFELAALRRGAVDQARKRKPSIPRRGHYDIPIRDELDLVLRLG